MTPHPTLDEIARLLNRLDPRVGEPCRVPGCRHDAHEGAAELPTEVPLAA